ncbi:MAG: hypothetical protein GX620_16945 [Chloroflexi bacterium]|nr:hypothetical protein [Chloroflexota bacterium]
MNDLKFDRAELPVAYSMVKLAKQTEEPLQAYMCYWIAFNNIYNEIARRRSSWFHYEKPRIAQARLAFTPELKHALIQDAGVEYFVNRAPSYWHAFIESAEGTKPNGVLNVGTTRGSSRVKWSGINVDLYQRYPEGDLSDVEVNMLVEEIVGVLYTVRNNLFHGDKQAYNENELEVVRNALPLLSIIVESFMWQD